LGELSGPVFLDVDPFLELWVDTDPVFLDVDPFLELWVDTGAELAYLLAQLAIFGFETVEAGFDLFQIRSRLGLEPKQWGQQ
jgi:hypothetical protein